VTRRILFAVALLIAAWALIVVIQTYSRDPEITNPADTERTQEDAAQDVEFFVSDPSLLVATGKLVEERAVDETSGKGLADAPYLIQFSDGRYAYGYADDQGRTRPLYASQSVTHEVFWYDEAWERRRALHKGQP
jgi:hypothetical protein